MALKARLRTDALGNVTVHMEGGLDYENGLPLKKELNDMAQRYSNMPLIIDLSGLNFVGSSGIGHFVELIKEIEHTNGQIKLTNVKSEFKKVFKLYGLDLVRYVLEEFDNDETENLSQRFSGKKRTFEN